VIGSLHTWTTPNGRKISIALEEFGLPYTVHAVDISNDEQFQAGILKISPNNRSRRSSTATTISAHGIRRDPDLSRDKTGKLLPKIRRGALPHHRMADVADGGPGPDVRPGPSLREIQTRAKSAYARSGT